MTRVKSRAIEGIYSWSWFRVRGRIYCFLSLSRWLNMSFLPTLINITSHQRKISCGRDNFKYWSTHYGDNNNWQLFVDGYQPLITWTLGFFGVHIQIQIQGCWWGYMGVCQQSVRCLLVAEIGCCLCSSIPLFYKKDVLERLEGMSRISLLFKVSSGAGVVEYKCTLQLVNAQGLPY